MTLYFRIGVTPELTDMVFDRLRQHAAYTGLVNWLGRDGVLKKLNEQEWCAGMYIDDTCIAALWGNETINLCTCRGYEKKWINRTVYRQFWKFFFTKYDKARATPDNGMVIPFLMRMGFRWEGQYLVCWRQDLMPQVRI